MWRASSMDMVDDVRFTDAECAPGVLGDPDRVAHHLEPDVEFKAVGRAMLQQKSLRCFHPTDHARGVGQRRSSHGRKMAAEAGVRYGSPTVDSERACGYHPVSISHSPEQESRFRCGRSRC